ncbi:hypothetical protein PFICI_11016 [Pestalotiopsis fici W106-1]|uniref:CTLH domain-containing protein n=1 Tax=Pestalotiopsis fici (strain W106-1 / CGMCC3.15140) TaxID=1229662 RepID=W3WVH5_PESFW|nr:uncharacterized protein PFICI_11016 [Pestalotiopsis fici W106-1]ETS77142.1 hypothetical protein PFICI_11016 [Pestalotiopsis fici W106-1]
MRTRTLLLRAFKPSLQTLVTAGTSFPAAKVEVAEPDPTSTFTPSASDDPSIPPTPNIPPNTILSAPAPAPDAAEPSSSSSPQPSSGSQINYQPRPPTSPPTTRQILGRRRRGSGDEYDVQELGSGYPEASASSNILRAKSTPKRRRANETMLADMDQTSASNGTSKAFANGKMRISSTSSTNGNHKAVAATNGSSKVRAPDTYLGHDREEVTRILIQALSDMGYHGAAESVSKDSGFELENQTVSTFRSSILDGAWAQAEDLLTGATSADSRQTQGGNGLVLSHDADRNLMRFWIRQQKYLELLEERNTSRALAVLRNEVTPLYHDPQKLQFLSSLLMCPDSADLKASANWDGAYGTSRQILLSELSKCISASVMLPEHRLAVLLQQVKRTQIGMCMFHSSSESPSLYSDHACDRRQFPSETVIELDHHEDEVWQVAFSHDGTKLASCGGDRQVIIYDVPSFKVLHTLGEHEGGVGNVAWSWDDSMLVACCQRKEARLWDTNTGALIRTVSKFSEPVSSCVWAPDNQSFILGSLDKEQSLTQWDIQGHKIVDWSPLHRVEDMAASPDGRWLVAMDDKNHIHIYNFKKRDFEYSIDLRTRLTSVSISADSRYLLINHKNGVAELFDLGLKELVKTYTGHTGGDYIIRSAFGGANESFVISGSEDGTINIWHKATAMPVVKLSGHQPRTNAVSWCPTDPCLFASCGDDGKIKIWSNDEWARKQRISHESVQDHQSWHT